MRKGEVRVNGGRAQVDQRLEAGDDVRLPPIRATAPEAAADAAGGGARAPSTPVARVPGTLVQAITDAIIQEDERLIVINKPAGIAVHGGSGVSFGVIEALRAARPEERDSLELVHRLDRDTSGVLLVARKSSVLRMLHAQLREGHEFEKRYLALVKGSWEPSDPVPTRVHEPLSVLDALEVGRKMHSWSLEDSLRYIHEQQRGVVVLLNCGESAAQLLAQFDGTAQASHAPGKSYDLRSYGIGAQILRECGVRKLNILGTPRRMPSMAGYDLEVVGFTAAPPQKS